jgi:fatty-acyl-CoA synthase
VRVEAELPKLSSMKLDKKVLRREAWTVPGVVWRPARTEGLRPLTDDDRAALAHLVTEPAGRSLP